MQIDSNERLEERPMMQGQGHVHPAQAAASSSSDFSGEMINQSVSAASDPSSSSLYSLHLDNKPAPAQPGTHVVQVPKDKVFCVPPPENARLFQHYTRRSQRRRGCSCVRVCTWTLCTALALAAAAGATYLAVRPRRPSYAVSGLAGVGNASAPSTAAVEPAFDATVRADNPNGRIGVHYDGGASRVSVSYDGVLLAEAAWPALFYQEPGNVTVFVATVKGPGLRLSQSVRGQMAAAERLRSVPFDVGRASQGALHRGGRQARR
jgi:hypothetical protein